MSEQILAKKELFTPGHYGCPGCGATVAMRQTLSVLGEDTIVVMTAGCWPSLIGIYPFTCPTGWRYATELSIEVARQAVKSRVFPLYEVFNGDTWQISSMPEKESVDAYLKHQGRFKKMSIEERDRMQMRMDDDWQRLINRCQTPNAVG